MELTEEQKQVLQLVLDHRLYHNVWPTCQQSQRTIARQRVDIDVRNVLHSLPSGLATPGFLPPECPVELTVAGIAVCAGGEAVLNQFVRVVGLAAKRYLADDLSDAPSVSAADLRSELKMPEHYVELLGELIAKEPYLTGSGFGGPDWTYQLDDRVRYFRSVSSVQSYLEIRESLQPVASAALSVLYPVESRPESVVLPNESEDWDPEAARRLAAFAIRDEQLRRRCLDLLVAEKDHDRPIREACVVLEDRVRRAIGAPKTLIGVDLMRRAFGRSGQLRLSDVSQEQVGAMELYAGVMAFYRNSTGHSVIEDYKRSDAVRFVIFVDLLLGMVAAAVRGRSERGRTP